MPKNNTDVCEGSSHCQINGRGEVCAEVVVEASKCVGDLMAQQLKMLPCCPEQKTAFDAATEPMINIAAYFVRICTYSRVTPETIVCAHVQLKKVCRNHPHLSLTNFNAHRLLVASMMVFSKYYDDGEHQNMKNAPLRVFGNWG
jgi:hypothetical protein